ncbi:MAG: cobalamin-dependent protein [Planctomycetes bacterium]|nr:cobalamin-dependent protein [Planctomycetota bacterium]
MARIAFINPSFGAGHYSRASRSPAVAKSGTVYYPYWLCYAAGWAEDRGHDASVIDAAAAGLSHQAVTARLAQAPPDLVVIDTTTPSIYSDLELAAAVRRALPDVRIVAVGTHASALPDEVLRAEPALDAVARGEYDVTVSEYAGNSGSPAQIHGLTWRDSGGITSNPDRPLLQDLDSLPFVTRVYRDHLNINDYFWSTALHPMVMIITGRGCPNRCSWCLYPQTMHGRKFRFRSAANVVDEFEFVSKELPSVREIGIEDDTFTASTEHARGVCELLLRRGIDMRWWANVRANLDFDTMQLMKRAGCRLFIVGFEAGSQDVLNNIRKGIRIEHAERFMEYAHKLKVPVRACFVLGQVGDTPESMRATLDLALRLDPDTAQFFPMIVYPGTEAYTWAEENARLVTRDFSQWLTPEGTHNSVVRTDALSPDQVMAFVSRATRRFYLRPRIIFRTLFRACTSFQELRRILKAMRRFWKFLIR